ncbi:hypothetical protein WJX81_007409 [Elliptochloris bilobata]|uniref:Membrin n=1 Tax=Elliptochloris bilobata TaxID=381761 RepID=A0AAW1QVF2_9CHLO
MSTDLAVQHKEARSLILALRERVEQLEKAERVNHLYGQASGQTQLLEEKLAALQRISQQMDSTWRMQVVRSSTAKSDIWKRRVEQVAEETDALKAALDKHTHHERRRQVEDQERAELLARHAGQAGGPNASWRGDPDEEAQAASFVASSRRALEEAFETGSAALASMSGQRERLKSAQRKALDLLNSIGLSDSVLRMIDRRQQWDKWLTYGGMVVTLAVLALLWWWMRARKH